MIDFVINIIYRFFRVYFLFRFHNRDVNNFDNKNDTNC